MKFCKHLRENNQDYFAHTCDALMFSAKSFVASVAFFFHAFVPCTFQHTGSTYIKEVYEFIQEKDRMNEARERNIRIAEDAARDVVPSDLNV